MGCLSNYFCFISPIPVIQFNWLDFAEIVNRIESKQKRLKSPHDGQLTQLKFPPPKKKNWKILPGSAEYYILQFNINQHPTNTVALLWSTSELTLALTLFTKDIIPENRSIPWDMRKLATRIVAIWVIGLERIKGLQHTEWRCAFQSDSTTTLHAHSRTTLSTDLTVPIRWSFRRALSNLQIHVLND
jgi:hypothetical protein